MFMPVLLSVAEILCAALELVGWKGKAGLALHGLSGIELGILASGVLLPDLVQPLWREDSPCQFGGAAATLRALLAVSCGFLIPRSREDWKGSSKGSSNGAWFS